MRSLPCTRPTAPAISMPWRCITASIPSACMRSWTSACMRSWTSACMRSWKSTSSPWARGVSASSTAIPRHTGPLRVRDRERPAGGRPAPVRGRRLHRSDAPAVCFQHPGGLANGLRRRLVFPYPRSPDDLRQLTTGISGQRRGGRRWSGCRCNKPSGALRVPRRRHIAATGEEGLSAAATAARLCLWPAGRHHSRHRPRPRIQLLLLGSGSRNFRGGQLDAGSDAAFPGRLLDKRAEIALERRQAGSSICPCERSRRRPRAPPSSRAIQTRF